MIIQPDHTTEPTDGLELALGDLPTPRGGFAPPRLEGADVAYVETETALGPMVLAARRDGVLLACTFAPASARVLDRLAHLVSPRVVRAHGPGLDEALRQLEAYLGGRLRAFDLPLDTVLATGFQRQVLRRLPDVGYGERISYGQLASRLGRPGSARAVGSALGANPLCVVLPCHRVVAASGALTGYAGGLEAKRLLLDLESGRE